MISKLKEFIGVGIVFGGTGGIFLVNLAIDYYVYPRQNYQQTIRNTYLPDCIEPSGPSESSGPPGSSCISIE